MSTRIRCLLCLSFIALGSATAAVEAVELKPISGLTEAYRSVIIKSGGKRNPPWNGKIARVLVAEGDQVEAGQVVIELEKGEEELEAKLRKLVADSNAEQRSAAAKEQTYGAILKSGREIFRLTKSISKEDLERKELDYRVSVAERQRLEVVKQRERIESEIANDSVARRTIRAPIKGIVTRIALKDGEFCEPSDPLMQVVDVSRGYFIGNVEEKVGRMLMRGQSVDLKIQTGTTTADITGKVVFVSPIVDPSSGLLPVKVEFENAQGHILPGVPGTMLLQPQGK